MRISKMMFENIKTTKFKNFIKLTGLNFPHIPVDHEFSKKISDIACDINLRKFNFNKDFAGINFRELG